MRQQAAHQTTNAERSGGDPERPCRVREISALAERGLPQSAVAERLGVSRQRISTIAKRHGVTFRPALAAQATKDALVSCRDRGMTRAEAAEALGCCYTTILNRIAKHRIRWPKDVSRPKQHGPVAKAILENVAVLASRGFSKAEAAAELGIDRNVFTVTVHRYCPGVPFVDGRRKRACRADGRERRHSAA